MIICCSRMQTDCRCVSGIESENEQPTVACPYFITGRNEVVAKVMFLLVSVILSKGGCAIPACLAAGLPGGPAPGGVSLAGGPPWQREWVSLPGGWPSGLVAFWLKVVFCYDLLVWPSGTGGSPNRDPFQPEAHNKRPHQKATKPESHNRRLPPPPKKTATVADGTHPTGMHSCKS